jgi:hypothetical protein
MQWNQHFYVVYGAIVDERLFDAGGRNYVIRKLLLLDPETANGRSQKASFDRLKDDWSGVQGFLYLIKSAP